MTDGIGTTTYSYYSVTNGQLGARQLQSIDGPWTNDTVAYFYDALGRATNRAINDVGQTVVLDALGRATTITNAWVRSPALTSAPPGESRPTVTPTASKPSSRITA